MSLLRRTDAVSGQDVYIQAGVNELFRAVRAHLEVQTGASNMGYPLPGVKIVSNFVLSVCAQFKVKMVTSDDELTTDIVTSGDVEETTRFCMVRASKIPLLPIAPTQTSVSRRRMAAADTPKMYLRDLASAFRILALGNHTLLPTAPMQPSVSKRQMATAHTEEICQRCGRLIAMQFRLWG